MIVTLVYVKVKKEHIDEFIGATEKNHRGSLRESGNLRFDILRQSGDPGSFVLYEAYRSEEAAAVHKQTPHYLEWREVVEPWMAEPRKGVRYDILQPEDPAQW